MWLIHFNNAYIMRFEFKNRVMSWATYSAIWGLKTLGFDCFSLLRLPGIDWDRQRVLRMPLSVNSIYHFSWIFSNVALLVAPVSHLSFRSGLVLYVLVKGLGLISCIQSSSFNDLDCDLIYFEIFPKLVQIQSFCAHMPWYEFEWFANWNLK